MNKILSTINCLAIKKESFFGAGDGIAGNLHMTDAGLIFHAGETVAQKITNRKENKVEWIEEFPFNSIIDASQGMYSSLGIKQYTLRITLKNGNKLFFLVYNDKQYDRQTIAGLWAQDIKRRI